MGIWSDDVERTRLREALLTAWPGGSPPGLRWLNEGFGSAAFETDDGFVVLVAKTDMGANSRRVTMALTPMLARDVPVAVPQPIWSIEVAPGLPYGAYAYAKLPGRPWTRHEAAAAPWKIAGQVAAFILAVNSLPVSRAPELGVLSFEAFWQDTLALRVQTKGTLRDRLSSEEFSAVESWWDRFSADEALQNAPRCLVHGDLWWENLLVDEPGERLLGVIDFGDAAVIDPAYDFVPLQESGGSLLSACLSSYRALGGDVDDGLEHRLQRWWELRSASFFSLRASILAEDEGEIRDSVSKLRRSPILVGSRVRIDL
jgi:aminoglycoside 2''-phosphotransferase